jgi:hypothetical protein
MKWTLALLAIFPVVTSQAEVTKAQFDQLFGLCLPPKAESGWLELGWEIDLWKARERAAAEGKPIFLWEMDGHPLGCT